MVCMVNNILEAQCRSSLLTYQATPYEVTGWDKWEEEDLKYSLYLLLAWFPNLQRRMYYECD